MRVIVTGSTTWTDADALRREFSALPSDVIIVTGDTPGLDALAMATAQEMGLIVEPMRKSRADRKAYPDASWKGLNERMLATGIDIVFAFHPHYGKPGCPGDNPYGRTSGSIGYRSANFFTLGRDSALQLFIRKSALPSERPDWVATGPLWRPLDFPQVCCFAEPIG